MDESDSAERECTARDRSRATSEDGTEDASESTSGGEAASTGETDSGDETERAAEELPELYRLTRQFNYPDEADEDREAVAEAIRVFQPGFGAMRVRSQAGERARRFDHVYVAGVRLSLDPGAAVTLVPPSGARLWCRLRAENKSRVDGRELAVRLQKQ